MRIYVDSAIHPWKGQLWCHLFSPDIDALHLFAKAIGMRREWFQDPKTMNVSWPHYDINSSRRSVAVQMGAVELGKNQTSAMSKIVINRYMGLEGTDREIDPLSLHKRINSPLLAKLSAWIDQERELERKLRSSG